MTTPLAVVAALEDEIRPLRSRLPAPVPLPLGPGLVTAGAWGRLTLLLIRTGVGATALGRLLPLVWEQYSPALGLMVGYAGATQPELAPGDLVIATALIDAAQDRSYEVAPELVAQADQVRRQAGLSGGCGPLVSVAQPALTPAAKAAVGRQHRALALDLESAAFAATCRAAALPFLVVRVILDPLEFRLPDLSRKDATASGDKLKKAFKAPPLSGFAEKARHSLTAFTTAWLDSMAAEGSAKFPVANNLAN